MTPMRKRGYIDLILDRDNGEDEEFSDLLELIAIGSDQNCACR